MKKLPAYDKWVCLPCRWTAKVPLVDARVPDRPSYRCPRCRAPMRLAGTAFRPPTRTDEEGWRVLEQLFAAGFRFDATRERRRVPRTLREVEAWLAERQRPDGWVAERRARIRHRAGRPVVRCGELELEDREHVLLWHAGAWLEGTVLLPGPGGVPRAPLVKLTERRRTVLLPSGARLRLRSKRGP